ncbi:MAG TPA: alpha/beta fold hydrolase [Vicinamibacterales bacterium]
MPSRHCMWVLVAILGTAAAAQQSPSSGATGYTVFLRGSPIGHEDVTVRTDATGISISSESRASLPEPTTIRRAEVRYASDWTTESFTLDATVSGGEVTARSSFREGVAITEGAQSGTAYARQHNTAAQTVVLMPNAFFGGWEAITRRVTSAAGPVDLRAYVLPQAELGLRVASVTNERMQVGTTFFDVRRYDVVLQSPTGDLHASITATAEGSLVRMSIPAQALDVVRDDVASSTSRTQIYSNPGDEAATVPAPGFNLGTTMTRPKTAAARLPVAILLSGAGIGDRDGTVAGVPMMAQLAGRLADAGIMAVRYDKRGFGQSGGRAESATLNDYAEDARTVVRWLAARKDVDGKRIAVIGHSEGAWVGMLAAAREGRIAALVTLAGAGSTGADLTLEQQQAALDQTQLPDAEREARVALQKQIHAAVLTGKGWEGVPLPLRRQADTPWFQSVLTFDPARSIKGVRQPILIVHGALDKQVPLPHAERLADLARKESKSKAVELVVVRGVNHLLAPAITGEVAEYDVLPDRSVSPDVSTAVTTWLTKTFQAVK